MPMEYFDIFKKIKAEENGEYYSLHAIQLLARISSMYLAM